MNAEAVPVGGLLLLIVIGVAVGVVLVGLFWAYMISLRLLTMVQHLARIEGHPPLDRATDRGDPPGEAAAVPPGRSTPAIG
jgi:hypothetical protein